MCLLINIEKTKFYVIILAMSKNNAFYITTTLPYVNAEIHLGHAAEFIRADAVARYQKIQNREVFFNTGVDEHGQKILEQAQKNNQTPQEFVDQKFIQFQQALAQLNLLPDLHLIRTTDPKHLKAAQEFWRRVRDNGYIYKKNYLAKYCVGCEAEKTDSELENGRCPLHPNRELDLINEENYFFKYSEFGEQLLALYQDNLVIPDFRQNEIKEFVRRGLQDFSISRLKTKMPWGVAVPDDEDQVMYVWFDALVSYISTLGFPDNTENWQKFWQAGEKIQTCGKDNNRFQSAMWQAMLLAAGLPTSDKIIINGFVTAEGGLKMSKSLGNVVSPQEIITSYGTEPLRYYLLAASSVEDYPFSLELFKNEYNAKLANGLGNLVSRILKMAVAHQIKFQPRELAVVGQAELEYHQAFAEFNLQKVCEIVWNLVSEADKYIQANQPFKTIKTDPDKGEEQLRFLLNLLNKIAELLKPLLPNTAEQIITLIKNNQNPTAPLFIRKD